MLVKFRNIRVFINVYGLSSNGFRLDSYSIPGRVRVICIVYGIL